MVRNSWIAAAPFATPCDPCENGVWDQVLGEQWVDCGGACAPCEVGFNGQLDPGETGIDCGGDTGIDCGELCGDWLAQRQRNRRGLRGPRLRGVPELRGRTCSTVRSSASTAAAPTAHPAPLTEIAPTACWMATSSTSTAAVRICPPCDGNMDLEGQRHRPRRGLSRPTCCYGGLQHLDARRRFRHHRWHWHDPARALRGVAFAGAQISLNESSAPAGACTYNSPSGQTYTSAQLAGANFTVDILYILPESRRHRRGHLRRQLDRRRWHGRNLHCPRLLLAAHQLITHPRGHIARPNGG